MAYTKTVWQTGDVITAEKLNNMESGIEKAHIIMLNEIEEEGQAHLPLTVAELFSALAENIVCVGGMIESGGVSVPFVTYFDSAIYDSRDGYTINFKGSESLVSYNAMTESDYPAYDIE